MDAQRASLSDTHGRKDELTRGQLSVGVVAGERGTFGQPGARRLFGADSSEGQPEDVLVMRAAVETCR